MQEDFHHRRGEEAQAAGDEDGHQAEEAVQKAAQDGAHQIRQGIDLNDHAVGLHQVLVRREGWDAGLDGGLVKRLDNAQQHHQQADDPQAVADGEQQGKNGDQAGGGEVQSDHDVPPVYPVGDDAAHRRKQDGGNHGDGQNGAEGGGGAGEIQHIHGQGEAQDGVTEQGNDLADDHQAEVPMEQFFRFHSRLLPWGWQGAVGGVQAQFSFIHNRSVCKKAYPIGAATSMGQILGFDEGEIKKNEYAAPVGWRTNFRAGLAFRGGRPYTERSETKGDSLCASFPC